MKWAAPAGVLTAGLLGACTASAGVGGAGPGPDGLAPAVYEAAATRRATDAGISVGAVSTVAGARWRTAAREAATLGAALAKARPTGLEVEVGSGGFCARSRESSDCMFVTVLGATEGVRFADLDPAQVDAVVVVRTAPPGAESRMQWREELRIGRLFIFLSGWHPPGPS